MQLVRRLHQSLIVVILFFIEALTAPDEELDKYDMVIHTDDLERIAKEKTIPVTTREGHCKYRPPPCDETGDGSDLECKDFTAEDVDAQDEFKCHLENNFSNFRARVFGIVGMFNKGKTWFINRLFGKRFGEGEEHTTKGLSLLYAKSTLDRNLGDKWLVIDTAGTHATISFKDKGTRSRSRAEIETDRIARQVTMEDFVFDLVAKISDLIVFLVNDLTWLEQHAQLDIHERLIREAEDTESKNRRDRQLVIAHNYKYAKSLAEAETLFNQQVKSQDHVAVDANSDHPLFYKDNTGVPHIAFMDENADGGRSINDASFDWMKKVMLEARAANSLNFEELIPLENALGTVLHCTTMGSRNTKISTTKIIRQPEGEELEIDDEDRKADYGIRILVDGTCALAKVVVRNTEGVNQHATAHQAKLFSTMYKMQGYGAYEHLLVYQVDVPGVRKEDVTFEESPLKVDITRKAHYRLQNKEQISHPQNQYADKSALQGKYWAGQELSTMLNRAGNWDEKLTEFTRGEFEFDYRKKPSKRCRRDPDRKAWLQKRCEPYQIIDGILYIVGKQKPREGDKGSRRRLQNTF